MLPWGAVLFLVNTSSISDQIVFLGVIIVYTVLTIPLVIWHLIKLLPNLALIKFKRCLQLCIQILVEILSVVSLWVGFAVFIRR